jgi:putative phosphoesterase
MRLAVISDIHGNVCALEAVLANIRRHSVDVTVNLGDSVSGPLWPCETFALLNSLGLPTVRGNHDRWLVDRPFQDLSPADSFVRAALSPEERSLLYVLPATLNIDDSILAVHGTPTDDNQYLTEDQHQNQLVPASRALLAQRLGPATSRQLVLCGHSHRQSVTQFPGGCLIVNPGTVGCPVFADLPTAEQLEPRSPHARYAILTRRDRRWTAELFALEYDWERASACAFKNGFPRWAEALATGTVF